MADLHIDGTEAIVWSLQLESIFLSIPALLGLSESIKRAINQTQCISPFILLIVTVVMMTTLELVVISNEVLRSRMYTESWMHLMTSIVVILLMLSCAVMPKIYLSTGTGGD